MLRTFATAVALLLLPSPLIAQSHDHAAHGASPGDSAATGAAPSGQMQQGMPRDMQNGMQQGMMMNAQNCPCMNQANSQAGSRATDNKTPMSCSGMQVPVQGDPHHGGATKGEKS